MKYHNTNHKGITMATATPTTERKTNKTDPSKVAADHYMALTYWVKVKTVISPEHLVVTDLDNGSDINVRGKDLIVNSFSADVYETEEKVGKMAAAEILINSINRPITVSFQKDDGKSERVMKCRLIKAEALLGRSMVEDLEQPKDKNRVRQVDHRTINWLIVDGVKYTVK